MIINSVKFEFDVSDQEQIAKIEQALNNLGAKEKEIQEMDKTSLTPMVKALNKALADFFIETTGIDVLNGVTSYAKSKEFYYQFLTELKTQKNKILAPYDPARLR